jgi:hypothetical protein
MRENLSSISNTTYSACIYWSACLRLQIFTNKHRYISSNPNNISRYFPLIGDEQIQRSGFFSHFRIHSIPLRSSNSMSIIIPKYRVRHNRWPVASILRSGQSNRTKIDILGPLGPATFASSRKYHFNLSVL